MNNIQNYNRLPYIFIEELGGRFLLDTGASQSLIHPQILKEKKNLNIKIKNETHFIKTAHATSKHKQVAYIKLPEKLFNDDITHKFLIFNFDSDFVGLLGLDLLVPLNCKIDIKNMVLRTEKANIPIRDDIKSYTKIGPRCEQVINLLCNYQEGEYFSDKKTTKNGLIFPPALISVKEGNTLMTVINTSDKEINFKNSSPLYFQPLKIKNKAQNKDTVNKIAEIEIKKDKILKQNLDRLRTRP